MQDNKYISMPRDIWEKWDAALRSGEYKQCKRSLHDARAGGYCCLGVLQMAVDGKVEVDVYGRSRVLPSREWLVEHNITFRRPLRSRRCVSPWLPSLKSSADRANDEGRTFVKIADAIKETVVFV